MKVFITGVSSGIGREIAKELTDAGHAVWGMSRRKELLEELDKELPSGSFFYTRGDVSQTEDVKRVLAEMEEKNFLPDVVVLNAGVFREDLVPGYNRIVFEEVFDINFHGAMVWVDVFLDKFLARSSGQFIAISSTSAFRPDSRRASYSASKAALSLAFRSLALRYRANNIFFTIIYFGPVATPMSVHVLRDEKGRIRSKGFFVAEPVKAARAVLKAIAGKKPVYFFPYFVTLLFRLLAFLPDRTFAGLTKKFRKD